MEHRGTQEIKTKRLLLRRFRLDDAQMMYRNWASDERVTRFLNWTPYENVDGVRDFISGLVADYGQSDFYHWVIELKGQPVGSISVTSTDEKNHLCEVGYCIGCDWWGKGVTAEALQAVICFLFEEVRVHRVIAKHDVENPASGRVMEKSGMTYEGRLRGHYRRHDGSYSDALLFGMLSSDPRTDGGAV